MRQLLGVIVAIVAIILLLCPRMAKASNDHLEIDQARCTAAYHAVDDDGIKTWCRAAAEEYDIQASLETGEIRFGSMLMEGIDLLDASVSEGILGQKSTAHYDALNARAIFRTIAIGSNNPKLREKAVAGLKSADAMIVDP